MTKDKNELILESDETKWLKSIIPFDYLNQILETAANNLNSQSLKNSSISPMNSNSSLPSNKSSSSLNQQLSVNNNTAVAFTVDSPEVILSLIKESSLESFENHQVVIININDKDSNCPGMLNEDKVLNEQDSLSTVSLFSKLNLKNRDQRHNNKSNRDVTNSINGSSSKKIVRQPKLQDITDGFDSSFEPQSKQGDLIIDRDDNRSVGMLNKLVF